MIFWPGLNHSRSYAQGASWYAYTNGKPIPGWPTAPTDMLVI